jgi:hypothetical protein
MMDIYISLVSINKVKMAKKWILPIHGGHIWRKKPDALNWELIRATKEALIAVNTDGRFVYALGY